MKKSLKPELKDRFNESEHIYFWNGLTNIAVRYYFYIQRGLALLNEFRYLIMAILAVYAILDLKIWWIMPVMFFVSIPVLIVLGWVYTHRMAKVMDYLNTHYSTHFSKYNIQLQEEQLDILREIKEKIEK